MAALVYGNEILNVPAEEGEEGRLVTERRALFSQCAFTVAAQRAESTLRALLVIAGGMANAAAAGVPPHERDAELSDNLFRDGQARARPRPRRPRRRHRPRDGHSLNRIYGEGEINAESAVSEAEQIIASARKED